MNIYIHQIAVQSHINIAYESSENMAKLKYLGMPKTDGNYIHE
jgi:hypothetical protein